MANLSAKQRKVIFGAMSCYQEYAHHRDVTHDESRKNIYRTITINNLLEAGFTREQVREITGLQEPRKVE